MGKSRVRVSGRAACATGSEAGRPRAGSEKIRERVDSSWAGFKEVSLFARALPSSAGRAGAGCSSGGNAMVGLEGGS